MSPCSNARMTDGTNLDAGSCGPKRKKRRAHDQLIPARLAISASAARAASFARPYGVVGSRGVRVSEQGNSFQAYSAQLPTPTILVQPASAAATKSARLA